jgi:hypothetical protein
MPTLGPHGYSWTVYLQAKNGFLVLDMETKASHGIGQQIISGAKRKIADWLIFKP